MPPKKNKGPRARNADSGSAPQPPKLRASQSRAQNQEPTPKPKPRSKTKPKPAATHARTSTEKTEKRRPLPKPSAPATKTGVRVDKATNTEGQARLSKKHKSNMARRRKNNPAASGSKPTPQLELPEGFTRQKKGAKNGKQPKAPPKETEKTSDTSSKAVCLYKVDPKHVPPPGKGPCTFNENRSEWASLRGKDVEDEVRKQIHRFKRSQLRYPSPEWTEEERKQLHDKYWDEEEAALYTARWAAVTKNPGSPKLFIASSMADVGETHPNHNSGLIRILGVAELRKMIIDNLDASIGDLTALAASCKRVAVCLRECFDFWDFTAGEFSTDQFIEKRNESGQLVQKGGVRSNILVISPISDRAEPAPYRADFEKVVSLCGAITEIPSTFRSIVLDQIPFLDVALFELMVKSMPNLERVSITRCVMLDITKLKPLLDVIKRHPRSVTAKAHGTNDANGAISANMNHQWADMATRVNAVKYIQLDFFPFFFHGPTSFKRLGSFGVTYNEPTFNTPKAVFALILHCWALAKEAGMDLVSDSSSFWSFVRQLPGPDALWSLKAREALITRDRDLALATSDKDRQDANSRFADDLTAALTGDNQPHPEVPYGMKRYMPEELLPVGRYWRKSFECRMCHVTYPRSLFPIRPGTCWGCKMVDYVEIMEDSHLRLWQESTIQTWLHRLPRGSVLQDLLASNREGNLGKALQAADCMDWIREYFLTLDPKAQKVVPPPNPADLLLGPRSQAAVQPSKQGTLRKSKAQEAVQPSKNKGTTPKPTAKVAEYMSAQAQPAPRPDGHQMSYASATSKGLPAQPPAPKPNVPRADGWPSEPEEWVPLFTVPDWPSEDAAEVPYWPPPPKTLGQARAAMARWRWNHSPATAPFDYRKGGPQRVDPCKSPLSPSDWTDVDAGAEKKEHFDLRWQWTEVSDRLFHTRGGRQEPHNYREPLVQQVLTNARKNLNMHKLVRDAERREQNNIDKQVHRVHHHHVEDCLYSMGTPAKRPFNLDKPVPDPILNAEDYQTLVRKSVWESSNYNHSRSGW